MFSMHLYTATKNMLILKRLYSSGEFQWGEFVLSQERKGRQRLFKLRQGAALNSPSGQIPHEEIAGKPPCQKFITNSGTSLWLRRPSLAEYVCLMQRQAAPAYPKDIWAMLGYLDIGGGSTVVEAGSGSGALTLHLSNQVGASGKVYSFETVHGHHTQAKHNYHNWCSSWNSCHPDRPWPDNVHFIEASVSDADKYIESCVDAVALDLVNPYSVVGALVNVLRPGSILAAYLPNVTQVLDLQIHLERGQLPLSWDKVVEVVHREWTVKPASSKHRAAVERLHKSTDTFDVLLPYIARPSHHQQPHTAFLTVLRHTADSVGKH